jgi:uncharacterized coiled-coil protein SlyX
MNGFPKIPPPPRRQQHTQRIISTRYSHQVGKPIPLVSKSSVFKQKEDSPPNRFLEPPDLWWTIEQQAERINNFQKQIAHMQTIINTHDDQIMELYERLNNVNPLKSGEYSLRLSRKITNETNSKRMCKVPVVKGRIKPTG